MSTSAAQDEKGRSPETTGAGPIPKEEDLRATYQQVCTSYHAIDDFRAKLLGFLPLVSAGALFGVLNGMKVDPVSGMFTGPTLLPLGIFGVVVTLGLFSYEIYGIKRCDALIRGGKSIERLLHVPVHFEGRPREVARFINEPFAAGIIYPAVLAAWSYLAAVGWPRQPIQPAAVATVVFLVGFVGTFAFNRALRDGPADGGERFRAFVNGPPGSTTS